MSQSTEGPDLEQTGSLERLTDSGVGIVFMACALVSVLTTLAIVWTLLDQTLVFVFNNSVVDFLTGTTWSPSDHGDGPAFGFVPLLIGSLTVMIVGGFVAIPIGTLTAIYLSEYASPRARSILKPLLEVLAGVPTIVYGIFALVYVTPALRTVFPDLPTFNMLSASLLVGIMTIPMVSSISEDAMNAVPDDLRQASYGLGATKFEVSTGVVVPAALSGIVSAYILAISRAIGETMIVTVAAGSQARMPSVDHVAGVVPFIDLESALLEPNMTITSAMIHTIQGDLTGGTAPYRAVFALGLTLFIVTLVLNVVSDVIAQRYREVY